MPRILEIGFDPMFRQELGEEVSFIDTSFRFADRRGYAAKPHTALRRIARLMGEFRRCLAIIRKSEYELVVSRCLGPPNSKNILQYPFRQLIRWALVKLILLASRRKSLVVIDMTDHRTIHPDDRKLLDRCDLYFKRELAENILQSLESLLPKGKCLGASAKTPQVTAWTAKLRPISLGFDGEEKSIVKAIPEKKLDVFFLGNEHGCIPARIKSYQLLNKLRANGFKVNDVGTIPREEFYRIMSESWLCLSPGGVGWDCYRHYEIPALGSCPVITPAPNLLWAPFKHAETAFVLDLYKDWYAEVTRILADKEKIEKVTRQAMSHFMSHHTRKALVAYIRDEVEKCSEQSRKTR